MAIFGSAPGHLGSGRNSKIQPKPTVVQNLRLGVNVFVGIRACFS